MFCSLLHLIWIVSCGCPRSLTSKGNRRTGRRNILAFPFPVETRTIAARCCPSEPLINSSTLPRFQNPLLRVQSLYLPQQSDLQGFHDLETYARLAAFKLPPLPKMVQHSTEMLCSLVQNWLSDFKITITFRKA